MTLGLVRALTDNVVDQLHQSFLSDPSPIIGYACHSLPNSLTDWLTHSHLVDLMDVTLACEDAYSKLVGVVTVADISDEDRVGNSLLQIWKLTFGHKASILFRLWAQGLVMILKLAADVWLRLRSWILVKILKIGSINSLGLSSVEMLMFGWNFQVNV